MERGYYTIEQMNAFNNHMKDEFKKHGIEISEVYCCPYLEHEDRKPLPGMFLKARDRYNIDMQNSVAVGDKERDTEAAMAAGVKVSYLLSKDAKTSKGIIVPSLKDIKL